MATDRIQLQALRSKDVLSGSTADLEVAKYFDGVSSPKLPTAYQLEFGEIALNIAKGYEVIAIKNYDGEIVYLPFNVASRLLSQETSLVELKEYAYSSIDELSGYTVSSFENVNVFIEELNSKIDNEINTLSSSLNEKIEQLSANTFETISATTKQLHEEIKEALSAGTIIDELIEKRLNNKINQLSATTIELISSFSGDTNNKFNELNSNLSKKIDTVSSITVTAIENVEEKINYLSGSSNMRFNLLEDKIDKQFIDLSGSTEDKINAIVNDFNIKLSDLSGKTDAQINKIYSFFYAKTEDLEKELYESISGLSATTDEKIVLLNDILMEKINGISAATESTIGKAILEKLNELSAKTITDKIELEQEISDLSANTSVEFYKTTLETNSKLQALSATTDEQLTKLKEELKEEIWKAASDSSGNIDYIVEKIYQKINQVSGESVVRDEQIIECINALSSLTATEIESLGTVIDELVDYILGLESDITDKISSLSTKTVDIETNLSNVADKLDNLSKYTSGTTSELINKISDVEGNIINVDKKVNELSSNTKVEIEKINESIVGVISTVDELSAETKNVEARAKSFASGYTNSIIASALTDVYSTIFEGDNNTKKESSAYTDSEIAKVNDKIGDLESSVEFISNDLTFVKNEINTLSASTDGKLSGFGESISALTIELKNEINTLSASTDGKLSGFGESISALTIELKNEISENDLVQAAALAKQNFELGFNENAEFQPESEKLQGRSVTGALDYLDEKVTSYEGECQQKYDDLEQKVIDDEKTHAGFASRINYSLGFDKNAIYKPETPILKGRNVTEAIDVVYEKLANAEIRCNEFEDYLYSEESMHFERSITYENLVKLVRQSKLRWGMMYRLTNYQATVDSELVKASTRLSIVESGQNTNNGFDIILRATSNNTLNENARLMQSVNSYYFEDCHLESWEVKYSLFNDHTRFEWADDEGFGVIYYMKDNYGNEASYDFKNIVFGDDKRYTFTAEDAIRDASMTGEAKNNIIKPYYDSCDRICLNNVLFTCKSAIGNTILTNTMNISLSGEQINNIISNNIISNNKNVTHIDSSSYTFHGFNIIPPINQ